MYIYSIWFSSKTNISNNNPDHPLLIILSAYRPRSTKLPSEWITLQIKLQMMASLQVTLVKVIECIVISSQLGWEVMCLLCVKVKTIYVNTLEGDREEED